jgi:hypothetical protein
MSEKLQAALIKDSSSKTGFNLNDFDIVTDVGVQAGDMDCQENHEVWTFSFEWPFIFPGAGTGEKGCI